MTVAYLFPGYSNQHIGMCKELYDTNRKVQEYFEEASACLSTNFVKLCFADSDAEISRPESAYPALFLAQRSCVGVLNEYGITSDVVSGHDVGLYSAVCYAKGITFPDGLYILSKWASLYSQFLSNYPYAASYISRVNKEDVLYACRKANLQNNGTVELASTELGGYCITGDVAAITAVAPIARRRGASVKRYTVNGGLFSARVTELLPYYMLSFAKIDCYNPQVPCVEPYNQTMLMTAEQVRSTLLHYAARPFDWRETAASIARTVSIIVVPFPPTAFFNQLRSAFPEKQIFALRNLKDAETIARAVEFARASAQTSTPTSI